MMTDAITFDLGGGTSTKFILPDASGIVPLTLPDCLLKQHSQQQAVPSMDAVRRFETAMAEEAPSPLLRVLTSFSVTPSDTTEKVGVVEKPIVTRGDIEARRGAVAPDVRRETRTEVGLETRDVVSRDVVRDVIADEKVVVKPVVAENLRPVAAENKEEPLVATAGVVSADTAVGDVSIGLVAPESKVNQVDPANFARPIIVETSARPVVVDNFTRPIVSENPVNPVSPVSPIKDEQTSAIASIIPSITDAKPISSEKLASATVSKPTVAVMPADETEEKAVAAAAHVTVAPITVEAPMPQAVKPVPEIAAASAASAHTEAIVDTVNQIVEAVAAQLVVTPGAVYGDGEVKIMLKPTVLDGSEIAMSAKDGTLTVYIAPATQEALATAAAALPRLETALAEHAPAFHHVSVALAAKKGTRNETV